MELECSAPKKLKQSDIGTFFGARPKEQPNDNRIPNGGNTFSITEQQKKDSLHTTSTRTLLTFTAEKWKSTSLAKYNADEWLVINSDKESKAVTSLNCSVCTKYIDRIMSTKGFQQQWCSEGSKRLQHSAAVDHAESTAHKMAFGLFLKDIGLNERERTCKERLLLDCSGQQSIVDGLNVMNEKDFEQTKKKFETVYFLVKNEMSLNTYQKLLNHEEKHGVMLGTAYRNRTSGTLMIDFIAESLRNDFKKKFDKANFYSLLSDGSTDASVTEKEALFVITFNPLREGSDSISVDITFFDLVDLKTADANGIVEAIKTSFEDVNIDYLQKLVGFGADGASVNSGTKNGVKTKLQTENEWLTFGWCVAHRLELALKDALNGTAFDEIDEMLLRLYYVYKKSPKKLRQLKQLCEIYEDSQFSESGYRPKKASGTVHSIFLDFLFEEPENAVVCV